MRLSVTGKGMQVSNYLENIVTKKASKLERYFKKNTDIYVTLSIEKSRHICEVTVPFDGVVLRTEEVSGDMYNSIDASLKKLERQIRRHRTKLEKRLHETAYDYEAPVYYEEDGEEEPEATLVRRKKFPVKPMDIDEAEMQMELLGHNFFVFTNAATHEVNVLYKRNDGDLGLLEPEYE
ncbi:MAG: ribosome-associated translation inhibitor RaiA [Christensenellaceae bacterium]|nr:ribosome-associated translation inhibitor RaiA [Christensenellaceae bacterium]